MRLKEAARLYLDHCTAKGQAPRSVQTKKATLAAFQRATGDIDTARVSPTHVDLMFAANSHWSFGTRNLRLTGLVQFFKWCRHMKFLPRDADPTYGWHAINYTPQDKLRIPLHEWHKVFAACQTEVDTIIVATGFFLFLRGSEQQLIQLKHLHLDRHEIEIYRQKSKQWDTMPISAELGGYLRPYLAWITSQGHYYPDSYLIPSKFGARNLKGSCGWVAGSGGYNFAVPFCRPYDYVNAVLRRAGYHTKNEGEHTLRRSGARAYFDSLVADGYDGALRRVQSMLGHKNAQTTEIYLGLNLDRHKRNTDLRGQTMFPALQDARVVPLRQGLYG